MQASKFALAAALAGSLTSLAQARPHHPPPHPPAQIVARQGDNLSLSQDHGWHKDVLLDGNTTFYDGRNADPGLREKLAAGDAVMVRDHLEADGRYHVDEVRREKGHPVAGKVLAVNDAGFLLDNHGEPLQMNVSSATSYAYGWLPAGRGQVGAGGHVMVEGKQVGGALVEAEQVNMPFPWMQLTVGLGLSGAAAGFALRRRRQAVKRPRIDD